MKPSVALHRIKEALGLDRAAVRKIYELEAYPIDEARLDAILRNPSSQRGKGADYEELGVFLDGLIHLLRGEVRRRPAEDAEIVLDNNLILKKLRVALQLREMDVETIFELADAPMSPAKIRDLFRAPGHPKFLPCTDGTLERFFEGLAEYCHDLPSLKQLS